jgi:hypothetical protein
MRGREEKFITVDERQPIDLRAEVLIRILVGTQLRPFEVRAQHEDLYVEGLLKTQKNFLRVIDAMMREKIELPKTNQVMKRHPFLDPATAVALDRANAEFHTEPPRET